MLSHILTDVDGSHHIDHHHSPEFLVVDHITILICSESQGYHTC